MSDTLIHPLKKTIGIFARQPLLGKVKTRLAQVFDPLFVLKLYEAFLLDTVDKVRGIKNVSQKILGYTQSPEAQKYFTEVASDYTLWPQPDVSLGERMLAFFEFAKSLGSDSTILIGTDSPTLPAHYLEEALTLLEQNDCVFGPATDGGYYLIGMNKPHSEIFAEVNWSTSEVLLQTMHNCQQAKLKVAVLPPWYDIDEPVDVAMLRGHLMALEMTGVNNRQDFPNRTWEVINSLQSHTRQQVGDSG